jgi:outer membrane protein TolC
MNRHSRHPLVSLPTLVAGLILPLAFLRASMAAESSIDPEVEKILRERVVVLQEAAKLRREAHRMGAASLTSTLTADQDVLKAELELAKSPADRLRVREEMLKTAETLEKAAEELVKSAEIPRMDLLTARANRLRALADLTLERKAAAR